MGVSELIWKVVWIQKFNSKENVHDIKFLTSLTIFFKKMCYWRVTDALLYMLLYALLHKSTYIDALQRVTVTQYKKKYI